MPSVSIVVPTFNEQERLERGLERLTAAAANGAVDLAATELLLVDDGSTDATASVASSLGARFPLARSIVLPRNHGKGAAVRAGMLAARGDKVVFADADMAIDPSHLPALLLALDRVPVAVGSRAVRGRVDYGSTLRTGAGRAFNLLVRALGHVDLRDTQCGFKGFRRGAGVLLAQLQTTTGYAFDVELLWLAQQLGLAVDTVDVTWLDVAGSSVRLARDSSRMLVDVVAARHRRRLVAVATLDGEPGAVPPGAIVVRGRGATMLVAGVASLGALRGVAGPAVRLAGLAELVALAPLEVDEGPGPASPPATTS